MFRFSGCSAQRRIFFSAAGEHLALLLEEIQILWPELIQVTVAAPRSGEIVILQLEGIQILWLAGIVWFL